MNVELKMVLGTPNVGVHVLATEMYAFVPETVSETFIAALEKILNVTAYKISISRIFGVIAVASSSGIVVSSLVKDESLKELKQPGINVTRLKNKFYALGNTILANDNGIIFSPLIDNDSKQLIKDTLGISDTHYQSKIGNSNLVGSVARATNKGVLVSPLATEEELLRIKSTLQVSNIDVGTINRGMEFISSGLIANTYGAICGKDTTGIELMKITEVLFGH
ncbi:MAG: translation initiation factor IF-6 [Candidatus Hermodarchaeota archaeon]